MIAYLKGEIAEIAGDNLVLEVNRIGYNIKISSGTAGRLPGIGEEVKIFTYTLVREDAFQLYGFMTRDELEIFKLLITVNGIGPKGGLAVLSAMSADGLRLSILSGDAKEIAKAPGIGKKTAERIILDLKDKVSLEDTLYGARQENTLSEISGIGTKNAGKEAAEALTALGYSATEALRAVKGVTITEDMDAGEILKLALRNMK